MEPKGYILLNKEFIHTKIWPGVQFSLEGPIDLEKEYKEALSGQLVIVMDVSVDKSCYLVIGESKKRGHFMWNIEKGDTREGSFLPVVKKNGIIMPAGLSFAEEFEWVARYMANLTNKK